MVTVAVNIQVSNDVWVEGAKLRDVYKVAGVHFHWGQDSSEGGSEHTVDEDKFPLEVSVSAVE